MRCYRLSEQDWSERQPDGGVLESCVRIVMKNFHSTNHWYDVPCVSSDDAAQYICMKAVQGNSGAHANTSPHTPQTIFPHHPHMLKVVCCIVMISFNDSDRWHDVPYV